ncbi:MAG: hydantoinase B/oxoprolinase family protein [Planctomycetota bacterium]
MSNGAGGSAGGPGERGFDPLKIEVFQHLFSALAEEMGVALQRSAFSANIKERLDFSCALFDAEGTLVAQAAHLPVHLGATPLSVADVLARIDLGPGDVAFHNDPFAGGTHLPDVTAVAPVFDPGDAGGGARPRFYVVSRAHHADVGGAFPGSMAPARDVHGEGLRLPPVRIVRGGEVEPELLSLFLANVRVPDERRADLLAQVAAARVGEARLHALLEEWGADELAARAGDLVRWTARAAERVRVRVPEGSWSFTDALEGGPDGQGALLDVTLDLEKRHDTLVFDFSRSADQAVDGSPVNTTRAVTVSAVTYGLRLLADAGTPTNAGLLDGVRIVTRPGTVVDAAYPAPVAAGNVEASQRLVDVVLGALGAALPGALPAASAGSMTNLSFGGTRSDGTAFTHYETHGGGAGGGPTRAGAHALQTHMTNTRNTPIEALENAFPVRVERQTVRRGSGGAGARPGGDGLVRRLRFLTPVRVAFMAERHRLGPWGAQGGESGARGEASLRVADAAEDRAAAGKLTVDLGAGSSFELRTPGGGGHGAP